jgi:hypothetical protein
VLPESPTNNNRELKQCAGDPPPSPSAVLSIELCANMGGCLFEGEGVKCRGLESAAGVRSFWNLILEVAEINVKWINEKKITER